MSITLKILASTFGLSLLFNSLCILLLDTANYMQLSPAIMIISFMIGLIGPSIFKALYKE